MTDWSELPGDVVGVITSFLPLADTHHFSVVCQNWYSITKEKRHRPAPQLPWLVLTDDESTGKRRIFNMSENKYYHFDIPELRGAFIVGSSFGWLFAVGPKLGAYLVNPFSGAKFTLPSLPIHSNPYSPPNLDDDVQLSPNGYPINMCFEYVQHILVRKAVLSSDPSNCKNFVVFIMLSGIYMLAFYKFGDTSWTVFDYDEDLHVEDIVYFKGQLYALLTFYVLATVDIGPNPKIRKCRRLRPYLCTKSYLVDYNGISLLLVARLRWAINKYVDHLTTAGFRVFKVDFNSDKTCELHDIDGHALFLGRNEGIFVRACEFNGCMANGLYFCDATDYFPKAKYGFNDMGVYNFKDYSIGHFYPSKNYHRHQSCPIWLVPSTCAIGEAKTIGQRVLREEIA